MNNLNFSDSLYQKNKIQFPNLIEGYKHLSLNTNSNILTNYTLNKYLFQFKLQQNPSYQTNTFFDK